MIPSDLPLGASDAEFDAWRLTVRVQGPAVVVEVSGEIDLVTSPQLQDAIAAAVADEPAVVVADLSAVTFLDSSGLQVLISGHLSVTSATRFAVVTGGSATLKPLQLTGLDGEIAIFDSLHAALAAG